jgi:hypothetical protein
LLRTAAVTAAATVTLTFDAYPVRPDDVVLVQPAQEWATADALFTTNVAPAVFGLAESSLRLLAEHGRRRGEEAAVEVAGSLAREVGGVRRRAYELIDGVPAEEAVEERLALRARALRLGVDAATALVAAGAGGAMTVSSPAQRKAREALFMLVQAQTAAVRDAILRTFAVL